MTRSCRHEVFSMFKSAKLGIIFLLTSYKEKIGEEQHYINQDYENQLNIVPSKTNVMVIAATEQIPISSEINNLKGATSFPHSVS